MGCTDSPQPPPAEGRRSPRAPPVTEHDPCTRCSPVAPAAGLALDRPTHYERVQCVTDGGGGRRSPLDPRVLTVVSDGCGGLGGGTLGAQQLPVWEGAEPRFLRVHPARDRPLASLDDRCHRRCCGRRSHITSISAESQDASAATARRRSRTPDRRSARAALERSRSGRAGRRWCGTGRPCLPE